MEQEISAIIEEIANNKHKYLRMLENTNIYTLRNSAADRGIEMTISEVEEYLSVIRKICESDI